MKALIYMLVLCIAPAAFSQVAINNDASQPDPSAMLDIKSTTRGLLGPRMTMAQRNAIISPATGLIIYQTDNTPGYYYNAGSPAAPSWIRHNALSLPYSGTASTPADAFVVYNTMGTGLRGISMNSQGIYRGVYGTTASTSGRGVEGYASSTEGANYGVLGRSASLYGFGVWGEAMIDTGYGSGVFGISHADSGTGVYAYAYSTLGENYGVKAFTNSAQGYSGFFVGPRFYVSNRMGIGTREPGAALEIYTGSNHLVLNDANGSSDRPGIQFKNNDSHYISGDDSTNELFGFYSTFSHTRAHDARLAVFGKSNTWWGNNISLTHTGSYGMIETDSGDIVMMPHLGKVGIGTTLPTAALDIEGQISIRGGSPGAGKVLTSNPFGVGSWQTPSFVTQGGTITAYSISDNFIVGSTTMDGNSGITTDDNRMFFNKAKGAFRAGYSSSTDWDDVQLGPRSAAFGLNTNASGNEAFAVGFGTTASGLSSMAFGANTTSSGSSSSAFGNATLASGNYSLTTGLWTRAAARSCVAIGEYNLGTGNYSGWVLTDPIFEVGIGTANDARANAVTVLKNGNVGIGIASPIYRLEVAGQIKIIGGSPAAGKVLTSDAAGLATWDYPPSFTVPLYAAGNSSGNLFEIVNQGTGPAITGGNTNTAGTGLFGYNTATVGTTMGVRGLVTSASGYAGYFTGGRFYVEGNTGIGNNAPSEKLDVNGNIKFDGGANRYLLFPDRLHSLFIGGRAGEQSAYAMQFLTDDGTNNGVARLTILGGNVGISNSSPAYKLDVTGNRIRLIDGSEWIALRTDGSPGYLDMSFAGGDLVIQGSAADENVIINPSMNRVGVRTWTPQYELDVNGSIRATGSVYYGGATTGAGTPYNKPDFVFDESYRVWSTDEVAAFLQQEKHLPWLTSVKQEQKENGKAINMTRMSFETVESVENLQLQVIELQKQIKQLLLQMEQLKAVHRADPTNH